VEASDRKRSVIDELTEAAVKEIETTAAEAAKAASIAALREQAAKINAAYAEAAKWQGLYNRERGARWKSIFIAGAVCLVGGAVAGVIIAR
jgi:hypothetical protein